VNQPKTLRGLAFSAAALLLASCGGIEAPLPMLSGDGFFDRPWPSDLRLDDQGRPDLTGFPKRDDYALLETYATVAESVDGFGNNSPAYLRFQAPLDTSLLPDAQASVGPESLLLLVDVDPGSAHRGERVPVEWSWQASETEFEEENLLAVRPVYGFPLRPSTSYALVVREPLARVAEPFSSVWAPGHPDHDHYLPLQETLFSLGIDVETVAVASVFTTQDPVSELAEYATYIQERLDLPAFTDSLEMIDSFEAYDLYEGWTFAPLFQEGERPYNQQGGGLYRNEAGEPRPYLWEWIRFSLAVPKGRAAPEEGWPLYIYSHGTGGDYISYANNGMGLEVANLMSRVGFVGLGIDQPLHGVRATANTDEEFHSFNILNPDSARGNFRQGALDQVFLAAAVGASPYFVLPSGAVVIDPDRMVFLGHSQGGISGALAGPFLGDQLDAMFLSGAGGGLGMTLMYREAGMDLVAVLSAVLELDEDEQVDTFHPVVALVQWLSDVTDPINYAPYWFHERPPWEPAPEGGQGALEDLGLSVGMSEGVLDSYTPYQTTEALAAAGRVPLLEDVASASLAHELRGLVPLERPVSGNVSGYGDGELTAGLAQYPDDGHFAVFDNSEAAYTYLGFLLSAVEAETPTIQSRDWRPGVEAP
jgi:predicted esterase